MFVYQLAQELKYASVSRMLDEMTATELQEWKAFLTLQESQREKAKKEAEMKNNNLSKKTF